MRETRRHRAPARRRRATAATLLAATVLAGGCVVTAGNSVPLEAEVERAVSLSVGIEPGSELFFENLAGAVTVEGHDGTSVELTGTVHGGGDDEAEARALAERIDLDVEDDGGRVSIRVRYPVDDYDRFHYPAGSAGVQVFGIFGVTGTRLDYQGHRVSISSRRSGGSASVWADLRLLVPAGLESEFRVGAGRIDAADVDGDVLLDIYSGSVSARGGSGRLVADTGSGSVDVEGRDGDVSADTGSGRVTVRDVRGDVVADTGSGSVTIRDVEAQRIQVDTGSGRVELENVSGNLSLDTGSGSIRGRDLRAGERVLADTGSGSVRLAGTFASCRRIDVDTGSGSVELDMTDSPSMSLRLSTGSGGFDVALPDLEVERDRDGLFLGRAGDDPVLELTVETGSGGIRVRGR